MGGSTRPLTPLDSDEYSAEKTLIQFPRPIPLLRVVIKECKPENSSTGPYRLAFKSPRDWVEAYGRCKAQIISQCESGARIGCSVSASEKCKPPWWKSFFGIFSKQDLVERAKCEAVEMEACFASAKEKCELFAKQKCSPAFRTSWVQLGVLDLGIEDWKEAFRLISGVCFVNGASHRNAILGFNKSWGEFSGKCMVSCVKGKDLLGSDDANVDEYLINRG